MPAKQIGWIEQGSGKDDKMLLIQPRKRNHAIFDHTTSHPASWQSDSKETPANFQATSNDGVIPSASTMRESYSAFPKTEIANLSLEQLQQLSALVEDRIQTKKRYSNTPLRRIIVRQVSSNDGRRIGSTEEDKFSQTDTLVNTEVPEVIRESPEVIQARYNSTPLRRILSQQVFTGKSEGISSSTSRTARYEPEPMEVRKARYNNTPLRRILSRQNFGEQHVNDNHAVSHTNSAIALASPQAYTPTPVPRSNTPLRRILSRQASSQTASKKEDDSLSERADSVIDPDSPIRSRTAQPTTTVHVNSEDEMRAHETASWSKSIPSQASYIHLNSQTEIRAYEEALWKKSTPSTQEAKKPDTVVIQVREVGSDAKKPKRIVVDSKGSPLRRILQRQTSRDWRAPARVAVV